MYKIVGADQKEYGPVTEDQLRQWIIEGRANAQTIVRLGDGPWKPLATFPEFASTLGTSASPAVSVGGPPPPPLPLSTPGAAMPPATNGLAIAGMICGILGLFCCGPVFSTIGLILSVIGLSQINKEPMRYSGKGLAQAGIALAIAGYVIFAILLFTGAASRLLREFPGHF